MMGATFTEQVIVLAAVVIGIALIAFVIGIWYGVSRNDELATQLEEELGRRRAFGPMPPEIAHEACTQRLGAERVAEEDEALTIANGDPFGPQAYLAHPRGCGCWDCGADRIEQYRETWPAVEPATITLPEPDPCTDTAWTRAMVAQMDEFVAGLAAGEGP